MAIKVFKKAFELETGFSNVNVSSIYTTTQSPNGALNYYKKIKIVRINLRDLTQKSDCI